MILLSEMGRKSWLLHMRNKADYMRLKKVIDRANAEVAGVCDDDIIELHLIRSPGKTFWAELFTRTPIERGIHLIWTFFGRSRSLEFFEYDQKKFLYVPFGNKPQWYKTERFHVMNLDDLTDAPLKEQRDVRGTPRKKYIEGLKVDG